MLTKFSMYTISTLVSLENLEVHCVYSSTLEISSTIVHTAQRSHNLVRRSADQDAIPDPTDDPTPARR
jgi:hypothetical protein